MGLLCAIDLLSVTKTQSTEILNTPKNSYTAQIYDLCLRYCILQLAYAHSLQVHLAFRASWPQILSALSPSETVLPPIHEETSAELKKRHGHH